MAAANEKKKGADGAPAVAKVEGKVQVASNKLGRVIGSGGETINAIRSGSGCDIELPDRDRDDKNAPATVTINVSGPSADAVAACKKAIKDVTTKGYCEFTVGDDFEEGSVMVPPQYFSELIGAGGRVIRCIQEKVGARLNIPNFDRKKGKNGDADSKPKREKPMRVGITGTKAAVAAAKEIVREIMRNYHHEVTHPGVSHADVDVPEKFLNILIGPKGSNIKHIQNNWKVRVNIPNELSANRCVVIVGAAANCAAAKQYVLKMMEQSQEKKKVGVLVLFTLFLLFFFFFFFFFFFRLFSLCPLVAAAFSIPRPRAPSSPYMHASHPLFSRVPALPPHTALPIPIPIPMILQETNTVLSQPGWGNGASGNGLEEGEIDPRGDDDDEEEGPHEEWMDDFAPPPGGIKVDLANGWGAPAETAWT